MPVELHPTLNRRLFLSQAGAAVGGLALGTVLQAGVETAAPAELEAGWLALISDTHIDADLAKTNLGQNMAENLRAVVQDDLSQAQRPAGTFINGDLALKDGQTPDYEQLLNLLGPLRQAGLPIHLGLGNHDHRDHFLAVLKDPLQLQRAEASKYLSEVTLQMGTAQAPALLRVIVLDSLNKVNITPGLLGPEQLLWLQDHLDAPAHATVPTMVLVHHDPSNQTNALIDSDALLRVLGPRRQVKALFFGHTHVWSTKQQNDGLWLVNLPAVAYPFSNDQPLGWVQCRPRGNGVELELRAIGGNLTQNRQRVELAWR